jgi:hypothetical protein
MDAYTCPKGHQSTESDFCSECGSRIGAPPVSSAATAAPAAAAPQAAGENCPDCGTARAADGGIFCEVCGYNFASGAHGEIAVAHAAPAAPAAAPADPAPQSPAAAAPPAGWTIVVAVDQSLREAGSPDPPAGVGPYTLPLDKPISLIGRRSESHAIFPEIPLNYDAAVSHRHALLQVLDDGSLVLRDLGAANGTRLNGKDVEPMVDQPLRNEDQITLGHWTRITVKAVR